MQSGNNHISEEHISEETQKQIIELKNRILEKLSSSKEVDACVFARKSVAQKEPTTMSACIQNGVFDKSGKINTSIASIKSDHAGEMERKPFFIDMNRIDSYLTDQYKAAIKGESGIEFIQQLSDRDKIALEAVLESEQATILLKIQTELLQNETNLSSAILLLQKKIDQEKDPAKKEGMQKNLFSLKAKYKENEKSLNDPQPQASNLITQVITNIGIQNIQSALLNNPMLYPEASVTKSLSEFITYLKKNNLWDFYIKSGSDLKGETSRFFNSMPKPPYLSSLITEATNIIKDTYTFQENLKPWLSKVLEQAWEDLFDDEGNIKKDLYDLLPEGKDQSEEFKKALLNAYVTMVSLLVSAELPPEADTKLIEISKTIERTENGEKITETVTVELPVKSGVVDIIEQENQKIRDSASIYDAMNKILSPSKEEIPFLLSHFKIENIEKVIPKAVPNQNEEKAFRKDLLDYQISHASQVQRWQEALHTRNFSLEKRVETIKAPLIESVQKDWRAGATPGKFATEREGENDSLYTNFIKPRLEEKIKQDALAQATQELKDQRKIEKAKVTLALIKSIKELIIANAENGTWKLGKFTAFFTGEIIHKYSGKLLTTLGKVPNNIAAIYNLCLEAEKKLPNDEGKIDINQINPDISKDILDIYKDIEKIGAKASHSFFTPLKVQTKEFYKELDRSHQERMAYKDNKKR